MARTRFIFSAVALTACTSLTGCGVGLTPELQSYSESSEQYSNRHARVVNNNTRQIWDDLENILPAQPHLAPQQLPNPLTTEVGRLARGACCATAAAACSPPRAPRAAPFGSGSGSLTARTPPVTRPPSRDVG